MNAALTGPFGRIPLGADVCTIGRLPDNRVVINEIDVSSHHAELRPQGQGYCLIDLESKNGTYVNEVLVVPRVPQMLNAGDVIRIAQTRLTFEMSRSQVPTSAAVVQGSGVAFASSLPPSNSSSRSTTASSQSASRGTTHDRSARTDKGKKRWRIPVAIGTLLFLVCFGGALVFFAVRSTPQKTLGAFCEAQKNQDYKGAYEQFSSGIKSKLAEADYVAGANHMAKVTSCIVSDVNEGTQQSTGVITYNFDNNTSAADNYILVNENGVWRIKSEKGRS